MVLPILGIFSSPCAIYWPLSIGNTDYSYYTYVKPFSSPYFMLPIIMKSSGKRQGLAAARRATLSFQPIQVGQGIEVAQPTAEPDHTTLNNCFNKIIKNYREYFFRSFRLRTLVRGSPITVFTSVAYHHDFAPVGLRCRSANTVYRHSILFRNYKR